ncbi:MAG TPA: MBL fold metallo-hydrolase [Leptospiraceae bacterium]|nr:MBL fold metallo-hydrolase [Leptospiraceae bacterium]HMW06792.1 MBL fold metallo-hydrolase [Leptospiraceae bacterium]HMX35169.1 MBL fold metallo-hydrolase [Leptospiraceae bacterium]HMY32262.1 MBL fold metallo-hydrolase [Leptospiraceae bacterium]HMZ63951.1 MBL fold metallo-hydrolase [Leptospiraceae bacterium]
MAIQSKRKKENILGNFYVDSTCIDCETCRILAPEIFKKVGNGSIVYFQPTTNDSIERGLQALVACPTYSIGLETMLPELKEIRLSFPKNIADTVYYNGYHSEKSYGAASYFIKREKGNILIDSPRFAMTLVENFKKLGGIDYIFLTHQDDIADQQKYADYFGAKRILHKDDFTKQLSSVEIPIEGEEIFHLDEDIKIIPVPGHTEGHCVLLYKDSFLFTGDHLAYSPTKGHLHAFRNACWYSWEKQIDSMKRLNEFTFESILPGHGRSFSSDKTTMKSQLSKCIEWMESVK